MACFPPKVETETARSRFGIMQGSWHRGREWTRMGRMDRTGSASGVDSAREVLSGPVRAWFDGAFPHGPTPAQQLAWPLIAGSEHVLLISPTGTGKTLAGFLAILDRLIRRHQAGTLASGLKCVYISPLRSLNYDIERNLTAPLDGIRRQIGCDQSPVQVGVRTGDTSASLRSKLRDHPPHLLITTPESLSLLLCQQSWHAHWRGVEHVVVDELHSLAPTKRGADLAVSLERLASLCQGDPVRVGLSATCRPAETAARFLVGPSRTCRVVTAPPPLGTPPPRIDVETLIRADELPHRGLSYRRLLRRLRQAVKGNRTTIVFANTRAFAEKLTHDLRQDPEFAAAPEQLVAAHHSALDRQRRRAIESALRAGEIRVVITSTSLELGVDIGTADLAVQVGLPGGVARCVQRVGRAGHRRGAQSRGLLLAATTSELAGAVVTARAARAGRIEPLKMIRTPLDVVCQQIIGMACAGETRVDDAYELVRKAGPMAELARTDFDDCLSFLSGRLAAPAGAFEPEPGVQPRFTSPRIWMDAGRFGLRNRRVARWFMTNVGTIHSEPTVRVIEGGVAVGTLEADYAERLIPGDRFVLDGRPLEFRRLDDSSLLARAAGGEPSLPRWTSDRQSLSSELATALARFRAKASRFLVNENATALRRWLIETFELDAIAAQVLVEVFEAQAQWSEIPDATGLLVEESPSPQDDGLVYTFHAPLNRAACEALARVAATRLGRRIGRDVTLSIADLGWSIHVQDAAITLTTESITALLSAERFADDLIEGLDRGGLLAQRFRYVAATALMVLSNPEPGRRVRVGGMNWVSTRLYPLVKAACPDHPLLRETRREVLDNILDVPAAIRWINPQPHVRLRVLPGLSPFAATWIEPGQGDALQFESPGDALRRLHSRLVQTARGARG
jgi:ATP-dependent helicase Lhr and Lhr-like helicase